MFWKGTLQLLSMHVCTHRHRNECLNAHTTYGLMFIELRLNFDSFVDLIENWGGVVQLQIAFGQLR